MKGDSILLFLILFPMAGAILSYLVGRKNKKARDLLMRAPSVVTEQQLKDVHIKLAINESDKVD